MDLKAYIEKTLGILQERLLKTLDGVTQEELKWRPTPDSNSVGFILWHIFRVEDNWIQKFTIKRDELWQRGGYDKRFSLPERDTGFGYTSEQVGSLKLPALQDLIDYHKAVRNETVEYLRSLKSEDFGYIPRPDRRPDFTVARVFQQITIHEAEHMGQVAYVVGVLRGQGLKG